MRVATALTTILGVCHCLQLAALLSTITLDAINVKSVRRTTGIGYQRRTAAAHERQKLPGGTALSKAALHADGLLPTRCTSACHIRGHAFEPLARAMH